MRTYINPLSILLVLTFTACQYQKQESATESKTFTREMINPPNDWGAAFMMDQGHLISGQSRTLYLSGQAALETDTSAEMGVSVAFQDDYRGQFAHVLNKVEDLLILADMSKENIVSIKFYTTDEQAFLANYDVYANWISPSGIRPPQTLLGVKSLAAPGLHVEVEVVAAD